MISNPIIKDNFLLKSDLAEKLYHDFAEDCPIIDYHCHLPPKEIALNRRFENITKIWLDGDHYKWRAMRANGIAEDFITGNIPDEEKFDKWAETVPYTLRNPLYHWTHLELYKVFGIEEILNKDTAKDIYQETSKLLTSSHDTHHILSHFNVERICTTDDPTDTLEWHRQIENSDLKIKVTPAWRPDRALAVEDTSVFNQFIQDLSESDSSSINNFDDFLISLKRRHNYFHECGCRLADHGLEFPFPVTTSDPGDVEGIFTKLLDHQSISSTEAEKFRSVMLLLLAEWNHEKGWAQQFHVGALRDVNMKGVRNVGQACGYDSIADFNYAQSMGQFFNKLEEQGKLARTIVYNLNPRDNEMVAAMVGNFQDGSIPGKMQYGAAWWFLDQKDGIEKHINTISNQGLLSRFIGMLTDSRSFLSYSRHEYFRRILCNMLADDINNGELPNDQPLIGNMIRAICYENVQNYFNFN